MRASGLTLLTLPQYISILKRLEFVFWPQGVIILLQCYFFN